MRCNKRFQKCLAFLLTGATPWLTLYSAIPNTFNSACLEKHQKYNSQGLGDSGSLRLHTKTVMWPWTWGRRVVGIFNAWRRGDTQQLSGHHPWQTVISLFYIGSFSCPWFLTAGRIVAKWFFFTFEIRKAQKNALHMMMMVIKTARIFFLNDHYILGTILITLNELFQ